MAEIISRVDTYKLVTSKTFLDEVRKQVQDIKNLTIYQDPYHAATLIRWELSEFDPYFVHEDF